MKKYRIHPAMGIARLGNADPSQCFIGPEIPGIPANWDPATRAFRPFKVNGAVKKQAARFRVWEYDDQGKGKFVPVREINLDDPTVQQITWTVHLANRKASFFRFDGPNGAADNFAAMNRVRCCSSNRAQMRSSAALGVRASTRRNACGMCRSLAAESKHASRSIAARSTRLSVTVMSGDVGQRI